MLENIHIKIKWILHIFTQSCISSHFFLFDTLINDQNQQRLFPLMLSTDQNQAKDL